MGDARTVDEIERLLKSGSMEDPAVQAAVAKALASRQAGADRLWLLVVAGLLGLATIALAGVLYLIADGNPETKPELALTAFVGVLGGLLGLLIGAPWREPGG